MEGLDQNMLEQFISVNTKIMDQIFDKFFGIRTAGPTICLRFEGIWSRFCKLNLPRWVASESRKGAILSQERIYMMRVWSMFCLVLALKFEGLIGTALCIIN